MKKWIIITLCVYFAVSLTACSQNNDIQESETPQSQIANEPFVIENQALVSSGLQEALTDDVVLCVKTYVNYPPDTDLSVKTVETFKHEDVSTYLYIVPRYSGSSITIESMSFDEAQNEFVATGLLFESFCTDDYALLVQADFPESGPQLRVTVTYEDMAASYTPAYDGRGDTVYPYVKNGVLLDEAPFSETSDKTQTDDMPEENSPEILFEYSEADPVVEVKRLGLGVNVNRRTYILTQQGNLFFWGEDINEGSEILEHEPHQTRIPKLYKTDVLQIESAVYREAVMLKNDGTVWYGDNLITANPVNKICTNYSENQFLYIRDAKLVLARIEQDNTLEETVITDSVLDAMGYRGHLLILQTDNTLWYLENTPNGLYPNYNMDEAKLMKENVLEFDAYFEFPYYVNVGIVTDSGELWCWRWENWGADKGVMSKLMDGVKHVSNEQIYMTAVTNNGDLHQYSIELKRNDNNEYELVTTKKLMLENIVYSDGGESGVAIKDDGTIWFWGDVVGCPNEHFVRTPGWPFYEWQETPIQLTLNQEEADKQGIERMKQLLGNADDYKRLRFLEEHYDYYSTNFPEFFSDDELRKYKKS